MSWRAPRKGVDLTDSMMKAACLAFARDLFGHTVVDRAVAEAQRDDMTLELVRGARDRVDNPSALRSWALTLPWQQFCAVVAIVAGSARREILGHD